MCKGTWLLRLKVFTCYFIPPYFCPQQTAHLHICQLQASKRPLMCCSDRKCKVKVSFYTPVKLQLHSLLSSSLHKKECSHSNSWHSIQPNDPQYLSLCDAEQHTGLISCWFIIVIVDVFCLSVVIQTRHTASSIHNILLQFPQQTALKTTNSPAHHTLLDRLTSYILWLFPFQDTSCVMLSTSPYKHPYVTPLTRSVTDQSHYQSSHRTAEPQLLLTI
jgi:hypothetical protein